MGAPFENDPAVATIEALFEINAKLGDIRDHVFDIDLLGQEKTSHNLEATLGVTFFF